MIVTVKIYNTYGNGVNAKKGREKEREVEKKRREKAERRKNIIGSAGGLSGDKTRKDARFNDAAGAIRFNATAKSRKRVNKTQLTAQWLKKRKEKLTLDAA